MQRIRMQQDIESEQAESEQARVQGAKAMITCIPEPPAAAAAAVRAKGSWAAAAYTPLIKHQNEHISVACIQKVI